MKVQRSDTPPKDQMEVVVGKTTFDGAAAFSVLQLAFRRAKEKMPDKFHESFYTFAGQRVRFCIVGQNLAKNITQPFSHLRIDGSVSSATDLTIELWDEQETGVQCQIRPVDSDSHWVEVTATSLDNRFIGQRLPHTFTCFDRMTHHIVGSLVWNEHIFVYERAKPLARLLVEWHNDRQVQVIHAGLVAWNGQGVLLAAKSGSGKSTSTLACLSAGFGYLGEDYVGLRRLADGSFLGHSLYSSVFLETRHLQRFPSFLPYTIKGKRHEQKSAVILSHVFPERLERTVPIRFVLIPRITGLQESKISPASKGQALLALGPSSLLQIPSRGIRSFPKLAQLVEQIPCYWLDAGYDIDSIPRCIKEFLEKEHLHENEPD